MSSYVRHLLHKDYEYSLSSIPEFAKLRYVMKSKQRELKRQGLGNLAHKSEAITDEDIEKKLLECDQLGATAPESIINRSKAVPLLQSIFCAYVGGFICGICFVIACFSLLPHFGTSGRLYSVLEIFSVYIYLYLF